MRSVKRNAHRKEPWLSLLDLTGLFKTHGTGYGRRTVVRLEQDGANLRLAWTAASVLKHAGD
ncbi:MAG: hypothetical protein H5T68_11455 [Chloroflexi bacterium]|nr:hypothetical protein [Chloroflexota bacterium]